MNSRARMRAFAERLNSDTVTVGEFMEFLEWGRSAVPLDDQQSERNAVTMRRMAALPKEQVIIGMRIDLRQPCWSRP